MSQTGMSTVPESRTLMPQSWLLKSAIQEEANKQAVHCAPLPENADSPGRHCYKAIDALEISMAAYQIVKHLIFGRFQTYALGLT